MVYESGTRKPIQGASVSVGGESKPTDPKGFAKFADLTPQEHTVEVELEGDLVKTYRLKPSNPDEKGLTEYDFQKEDVKGGEDRPFTFRAVRPAILDVRVFDKETRKVVADAKISLSQARVVDDTLRGTARWDALEPGDYTVGVPLDGGLEDKYKAPANQKATLTAGGKKALIFELEAKKVYLQLLWRRPDKQDQSFPKDFPVTVVFDEGTENGNRSRPIVR